MKGAFRFVLLTLSLALPLTFQFPADNELRIANGASVTQGEFPYVVSVQTWDDEHLCGGFIYSSFHVVTAASCVYGKTPADIKILAGVSSLIAQGDTAQIVGVYRIDIHPNYNPTTRANDLAILKLASTFSFNYYVQHILYDEVDLAITTGLTMGWGATEEGGLTAINMRKLTLTFKPATDCQSAYGSVEFSQNYMICAGNDMASPCRYDEGSPLVQNRLAVGIMSRNKGCTAPYSPTVYTRLSAHYSWLLKVAGTQPPLPNTPYPTPSTTTTTTTVAPTTAAPTTASTPAPTTSSTATPTAGPSSGETTPETVTSTTTQSTTTQFVVPTAPCINCIPL